MKATLTAVAAAFLTFASVAIAGPGQERSAQIELHLAAKNISVAQRATWDCQDQLGVERSKRSVAPWQLSRSLPYRLWVVGKWRRLQAACGLRVQQRTIPATGDWLTAVDYVQRIYPGTKDWLIYISHREGGWGRFVMNSQGSGAGGWLQFMSSTYYAYNDAAYADARRRGFILDEATNSWTNPLGQAVTGAYMRYTGRDACHWCL